MRDTNGELRGIRDTPRDTGYFAGFRGIRDTSRDTGYFSGILQVGEGYSRGYFEQFRDTQKDTSGTWRDTRDTPEYSILVTRTHQDTRVSLSILPPLEKP